jgi:type VI secretion system secreted protein VgrG
MTVGTLYQTFQLPELDGTRVISFREERRLGRPPELWALVEMPVQNAGEDMIGMQARMSWGRSQRDERTFLGIVESVTLTGGAELADQGSDQYLFHVVTPLYLLDQDVTCEIHQEMTVKDIVSKVLDDRNLSDYEWRLTGEYQERVYCVQYNESCWDFVSRLLEEEGIYFFTSMTADKSTIVFADDSTACDDLAGEKVITFQQDAGMATQKDFIRSVDERHRVRSGKFVLRDYDFEKPDLDLTVDASSELDTDLERYDYPGNYADPAVGTQLATVRLEAEQIDRHVLLVEADCPRMVPGYQITIEDALHDEINGDYLVTGVVHDRTGDRSAEQLAQDTGEGSTSSEGEGESVATYLLRATLLPLDVPYRSPQVTPRPIIEGPQTAQVVAPAGSQEEEIHTDKWGRCKVRFYWDMAGINDDKASCWMRTKQMQSSGSMVLPRVNWEVTVEFLEGDPDRPVVTGRVYNGVYKPPYALPDGKSRTSIRSHSTPGGSGYNEVRFEDLAGGEEIFLHSQYDMTVVAANNKSKVIGHDERKQVAVDSTLTVGANQDVKVTMGGKGSIGADQTLTVGGNRKVEVNALQALNVGGDSASSIGGNHFEMDGDPLTALVNLAVEKATKVLQKKAADALKQVDAYVQDKVEQVMGPINDLQDKANGVAEAMDQVSQGHLGEVSTAIREASALPQIDQLGGDMRSAAFGANMAAGDALGVEVNAPDADAEGFSAQSGLDQLANGAIEKGVRAGGDVADGALHDLFGDALGLDGSGGGGASMPSEVGPELDQAGVDETDREKGPGHALYALDANLTETVGALKVTAAITGINVEVAGDFTQTIGAARVDGAWGDRVMEIDGSKDETCIGLVVLSKGDVSEKVSGSKTTMVGGAIVDLIDGKHTVEASGPATMIAALHKVTAKEKITFKVGDSEVVIEGGGVTFSAPIVSVLSPKIQITKKSAEN